MDIPCKNCICLAICKSKLELESNYSFINNCKILLNFYLRELKPWDQFAKMYYKEKT